MCYGTVLLSCTIVTRRDRDPEPHHDMSEMGGTRSFGGCQESGQELSRNRGGFNAEFPGSGELVSPSSLRAHTYM